MFRRKTARERLNEVVIWTIHDMWVKSTPEQRDGLRKAAPGMCFLLDVLRKDDL